MIFDYGPVRYIVARHPGPQTSTGAGDTVIDNLGRSYRIVDEFEAATIRSGTAGYVYSIDADGRIS